MKGKIPQRNDQYIWREIDGETFVLSENGKKIITLNKVASFIWQKCDGKRTLEEMHALILDNFDVAEEAAWQDLGRFVAKMRAQEMVLLR